MPAVTSAVCACMGSGFAGRRAARSGIGWRSSGALYRARSLQRYAITDNGWSQHISLSFAEAADWKEARKSDPKREDDKPRTDR